MCRIMRCEEARQFLWPYLDSELDDSTIFLITRHLEECRECSLLFRREEEVEQEISRQLRAPSGDESDVLARVLRRALRGAGAIAGRRAWRVLAPVAAVVLVCAVALLVAHRRRNADSLPALVVAAAADHQKFLGGGMQPEVGPDSVAEFFREKLGIDMARAPGLGGKGSRWTVDGGRLCQLRSARVGLVMLRYDGAPVSLFFVPRSEANRFPRARAAASGTSCFEVPGGHGVVGLGVDGTIRCAIGGVGPARLEGLLATTG